MSKAVITVQSALRSVKKFFVLFCALQPASLLPTRAPDTCTVTIFSSDEMSGRWSCSSCPSAAQPCCIVTPAFPLRQCWQMDIRWIRCRRSGSTSRCASREDFQDRELAVSHTPPAVRLLLRCSAAALLGSRHAKRQHATPTCAQTWQGGDTVGAFVSRLWNMAQIHDIGLGNPASVQLCKAVLQLCRRAAENS